MTFAVEFCLLVAGFLLGVWFTSMLVVPLFYGAPRAFIGIFRKQLEPKAIVPHIVAPVIWAALLFSCELGLAHFWPWAFEYLRTSGGFNFGQAVGTVWTIARILFSSKTRVDMRDEFDISVAPYIRANQSQLSGKV
jgi:hypothetical protein